MITSEFDKFLGEAGWEIEDLAYVLNIDTSELFRVYMGKKKIKAHLSLCLGEAFKIDGSHFIDIQTNSSLSKCIPDNNSSITERSYWMNYLPVREMVNRGWLAGENITEEILQFFDASSKEELPFPVA